MSIVIKFENITKAKNSAVNEVTSIERGGLYELEHSVSYNIHADNLNCVKCEIFRNAITNRVVQGFIENCRIAGKRDP